MRSFGSALIRKEADDAGMVQPLEHCGFPVESLERLAVLDLIGTDHLDDDRSVEALIEGEVGLIGIASAD